LGLKRSDLLLELIELRLLTLELLLVCLDQGVIETSRK
jgi:hypothetical protein